MSAQRVRDADRPAMDGKPHEEPWPVLVALTQEEPATRTKPAAAERLGNADRVGIGVKRRFSLGGGR